MHSFGEDWATGGHVALKFIGSLRVGDVATTTGVVSRTEPEGERTHVFLDVTCERQDGTTVTVGTADIVV